MSVQIDKSPEAIARRRKISEDAIASIGLEGFVLDDFAKELDELVIQGEITNEERIRRVLARCDKECGRRM